jgi:hypothetical protein
MAGMLNDVVARHHVQELLRKAEDERRGSGPRADRRQARHTLDDLLGRRLRGFDPRGGSSEDGGAPT